MVAAPTSSSSSPSIVVFGATGTQGGSVLKHLLASPKQYRLRAVTRDPTKKRAKELEAQGVEVVKGELSDRESVKNAMDGQDMVFAVTDFWEHGRPGELAQGKILIEAVQSTPSVKKFYYSGLPNIAKGSNGKYTAVDPFDVKAEIVEQAKELGIPIVDVQAAMYMENFLGPMAPRKQEDGSFVFAAPMDPHAKFAVMDVSNDYGAYVRGAIESNVENGTEVLTIGEDISFAEMADIWGQVTGQKAAFVSVPPEQFASLAGRPLTEMLQWYSEFGYHGGKDVEPSKKILPKDSRIKTFRQFVQDTNWSKVIGE